MDFLRDAQGKQLFAQVVEKPDSRAHRAVLSDWLIERGDPLGEFIALQLKRPRAKRVTELRRSYEADWLGPIHEIAEGRSITFSGGFLSSFQIDSTLVWDNPEFARLLKRASGHPALSLVSSLVVRGNLWGLTTPLIAFLKNPVFDRLQSICRPPDSKELPRTLCKALEKIRPGVVRVA